jgi:transcriptional regulator with XRE-family HTH domain
VFVLYAASIAFSHLILLPFYVSILYHLYQTTAIQFINMPMSSCFIIPTLLVTCTTGDGMKIHLKHIGENIRAARKRKNLTIDMLSEIIGISPSFLGTLERGESSLSIETLIGVCTALGVTADSIILTHTEPPTPYKDDKKDTIMTLLSNATDEELTFLIDYMKLYRKRVRFNDGMQELSI